MSKKSKNIESPISQLLFEAKLKMKHNQEDLTQLETYRLGIIKRFNTEYTKIAKEFKGKILQNNPEFESCLSASSKMRECQTELTENRADRKRLTKEISKAKIIIKFLNAENSQLKN
jgi:hypothetical protein